MINTHTHSHSGLDAKLSNWSIYSCVCRVTMGILVGCRLPTPQNNTRLAKIRIQMLAFQFLYVAMLKYTVCKYMYQITVHNRSRPTSESLNSTLLRSFRDFSKLTMAL